MNSKIYGTVSIIALVAANAAWAGSPEPFVVAIPQIASAIVSDFNGFYVGAAVTSTNAEHLEEFGGDESGTDILDLEGVGGAVHAGYNFAPSAVGFFYGGEIAYGMPNATYGESETVSVETLLTLHGRVGYVSGPLMYYATAGYAMGTINCDSCGGNPIVNETLNGYVIGTGVEYMISNNLSVRGQYEYFGLTGDLYDFGSYTVDTNLTASVMSVGLNYHF